nr:RNA polymerase sigma factor [Flavihumibacter fluvii]
MLHEPDFIERLQQGDETAFRQMVADWKDRIYNTALGIVQHESDADDITQEVFLAAWRSLQDFRAEATAGTWLYQITVRKAVDHLRKMKRQKRFGWIQSIWGKEIRLETDAPDFIHPGVQMEKKQDAAILFAAIRQLPEQQRIAFSLQKVEGLSVLEIAAITGVSVGAVESLLQRAKNNLRKSLATFYQNNRHEG